MGVTVCGHDGEIWAYPTANGWDQEDGEIHVKRVRPHLIGIECIAIHKDWHHVEKTQSDMSEHLAGKILILMQDYDTKLSNPIYVDPAEDYDKAKVIMANYHLFADAVKAHKQ